MTGFDPEYASIEDYTLRSSRKIWQDKALGLIYTHYAHNVSVHRSDGEQYGRDAVLEHAIRTLAAIPDLQLSDDEVISSGDQNGFLVSHRVTVVGHHFGYSQYGTPNERPLEQPTPPRPPDRNDRRLGSHDARRHDPIPCRRRFRMFTIMIGMTAMNRIVAIALATPKFRKMNISATIRLARTSEETRGASRSLATITTTGSPA